MRHQSAIFQYGDSHGRALAPDLVPAETTGRNPLSSEEPLCPTRLLIPTVSIYPIPDEYLLSTRPRVWFRYPSAISNPGRSLDCRVLFLPALTNGCLGSKGISSVYYNTISGAPLRPSVHCVFPLTTDLCRSIDTTTIIIQSL